MHFMFKFSTPDGSEAELTSPIQVRKAENELDARNQLPEPPAGLNWILIETFKVAS